MKRITSAWAVVALVLTGGMARVHGATNYWDNNGDAAGFGTADGTWGAEARWSVDPTGGSEPLVTDTTTVDDLFFGTDSEGLGTGSITVQGAQGFRSLTFGEASGMILITNGTLTLAEPLSPMSLYNPTNEIASALIGSGGLLKTATAKSRTYNQYLTPSAVVIVTNQSLALCKSATAVLGGLSISGGSAAASAYHLTHDGATATLQLQALNDTYIKCVGVELTQTGADIAARVIYAKYISASGASLGFDFDEGGSTHNIATSPSTDGYGVSQITLLFGPRTKLMLSGVNTYTGDTRIDEDILEIAGYGQLGGDLYTGTIENATTFLYSSRADQHLAGPITGAGKLIRESGGLFAEEFVYPQFLTTAAKVIYTNQLLSGCVAVTGVLGGAAMNGGLPLPASVYHYTQTPSNITYQLQAIDGAHLKCVKVELTPMSGGIAARAVYAKYFTGGTPGFDFDEGGTTIGIASSYTMHGYGVAESAAVIQRESVLTLAGTNTYTGGTEVYGGVVEVVVRDAIPPPPAGGVQVHGGEMILKTPGMAVSNSGGVGNGSPLVVNSGGTLILAREFNAGHSRPITLDGGRLDCVFLQNNDSANYVNRLILQNGARAMGYKLRVGYVSPALYTVSGSAASVIESGLNMARQASETMTFDVEDATADPLADLTVSGVMRDYSEALSGLPLIKTGAGTLCLSGANTHVGPFLVHAGAISLGANDTLNAGNPLTLNGGALEMGSFTNTLGALTVTADSGLTLGSGRIAFADSSAAAWSGTLALTGTLHRFAVRFGTDGSGLTAAQVSAIRVNGDYVRLRDDGYLSPGMKGTVLSLF